MNKLYLMLPKNVKYVIAVILVLAIVAIPIMYYRNKITSSLDVAKPAASNANTMNENPVSVSTIKLNADSMRTDTATSMMPAIAKAPNNTIRKDTAVNRIKDTVAKEQQPVVSGDNNEEMVPAAQDNAHMPMMEQPEPDATMDVGNSISNDKSVESKPVTLRKRNSLMVYPTSGIWQQMFIVYPVKVPVKISSGSFLTRTFDGVTYPSIRNTKIHWHGKEYLVMLLKVKGTQTSDQRPFYIYLNSDAKFVIFGDYTDRNKWYVYENNVVSHFTMPAEMQKDSL